MFKSTEKLISSGLTTKVFTEQDLCRIFQGTPASRYALINKAIKANEIIQLKRGVYLLGLKYQPKKISEFSLACHMVPHSHISFESALSYHGWIPEKVTLIQSTMHVGRSKTFLTPLGEYRYIFIPTDPFESLSGVVRETINDQPFLIAKPLRALLDLVTIRKYTWQGISFLTDSLRIELDSLLSLNKNDFVEIESIYSFKRVNHFIKKLKGFITS